MTVRMVLHVKTHASSPEIMLYSFDIDASTSILCFSDFGPGAHAIRASGADVQGVELRINPAMSCETLESILESLHAYKIQSLDISFNPHLGDGLVAAIHPVLVAKRSSLTDLKLANCGLTAVGLKWLVHMAKESRLRLLDISSIQLRGENELIEQVLDLPLIEQLAFCCCDFSSADVCTIAEGLPFTGVKSLNLAGNRLSSDGLVHLASKLPQSMVEELDLSGVEIEGECEGLFQLAKAWVERPFSKLLITSNSMTTAGISVMQLFLTTARTLMPVSDSNGLAVVDSLWTVNGCC